MARTINIVIDKTSQYLDWTNSLANNLAGYMAKKGKEKVNVKVTNDVGSEKSTPLLVVLDDSILANQKLLKELQPHMENNSVLVLEPTMINHQIPSFFSVLKKFEFYLYDNLENSIVRTGHAKQGRLGAEYWAKLFDLSNALLNSSKEKNKASTVKIFIAETGIDLMMDRYNLMRDLRESGAEIYPRTPLSGDASKQEEEVKRILQEVDYSVHLFGSSFDEFESMKHCNLLASQIAIERSEGKNPLRRFVWLPLGLKLSEEKKLAYEQLKRDYDALHGAELIQAPLETLKTLIYNDISRSMDRNNEGGESFEDCVYVINEVAHASDAEKVEKELNALGVKTVRSAFDKDDMDILARHKRILRECAGCILFYPGNNPMWIKSTMDDIVKSPGYGRKTAYKSIGLISPKDIDGMNQRFDNYAHIDSSNKLNQDSLQTFVQRLS